jgi:uncharacterized protein DUF6152
MYTKHRLNPASAVLFVLAVVSASASLAAHHGWTGYRDGETQIAGTIEKFSYENPHASVDLNVDGKRWHVVLAPPSRMESRGLQKDMLKVGGKASVSGYVHRSIATELRAERIVIGDKTTELR